MHITYDNILYIRECQLYSLQVKWCLKIQMKDKSENLAYKFEALKLKKPKELFHILTR